LDACTSYRTSQRLRRPPLPRFGSLPQQYIKKSFLAYGLSPASSLERDNDGEDDSIRRMHCCSHGVIWSVKQLLHIQRVCQAWSSCRACRSTEFLSAQHLEDFLGWIHQALAGTYGKEGLPWGAAAQEQDDSNNIEWNLRKSLDQAVIEIQQRCQQALRNHPAHQQIPSPPQVILHQIVQHMANHLIGAPLLRYSNMVVASRMSSPRITAAAAAVLTRSVCHTPAVPVTQLLLPSHVLSTTYVPPSFQGRQQQPEQGEESQGMIVHCLLRAMVAVCLGRRLGVDLVIEEREQRVGEGVRNDNDTFFIRLLNVPTAVSRDTTETTTRRSLPPRYPFIATRRTRYLLRSLCTKALHGPWIVFWIISHFVNGNDLFCHHRSKVQVPPQLPPRRRTAVLQPPCIKSVPLCKR